MEDKRISDLEEPQNIPAPVFEIGTKVRWNSVSGEEGVIRGMRYVWSNDLQNWQYQYYIALDRDNPSREWTEFDWGWQEDLEALSDSDCLSDDDEEKPNDQ